MSEVDSGQLQAVVQEIQLLSQQIQAVNSQINEISLTLEALEKQEESRPVFRAVGNLLLEVADREKLASELSASKVSFEGHLARMVERESQLREQYDSIVKNLQD